MTVGSSLSPSRISRFRIHGDNVVECERTLRLIEEGFSTQAKLVPGSSPIHPEFEISLGSSQSLVFELLPGHGRWGIDIARSLVEAGSLLRENADSVLTRIVGEYEEIILGIEFCGALPAGNQAWQRHGRALGFGQASIPYLIFTEVGGTELTSDRDAKASRLPNPATTFALLQMSKDLNAVVYPVYETAPSAPQSVQEVFSPAFGHEEAVKIISSLIKGEVPTSQIEALQSKTLEMVKLLANSRVREDALSPNQWEAVLNSDNRFRELEGISESYTRRLGGKVKRSETAPAFTDAVVASGAIDFFSGALPMTWLPKGKRVDFIKRLAEIYGEAIDWNHLSNLERDLVVIFVTGFKPRGDDSRPDRGLMPLGRMLAGPDAEVLTFLWGPAKANMLAKLQADLASVAKDNGLIESSIASSDFVLVDGINGSPFLLDTRIEKLRLETSSGIGSAISTPPLGEQDVDSIIHFLITQPPRENVFEGLCNPPGGDWSGISLLDAQLEEVRWTSLPRVSGTSAKRPDHVIQFLASQSNVILAIESKLTARDTEVGVGPDLIRYVQNLVAIRPNVFRDQSVGAWIPTPNEWSASDWGKIYSGAAFLLKKVGEIDVVLEKSQTDLVIALEYEETTSLVTIHLKTRLGLEFLSDEFESCVINSLFQVKVQKH